MSCAFFSSAATVWHIITSLFGHTPTTAPVRNAHRDSFSSAAFSLSDSELYELDRRTQGSRDDGRLAMWHGTAMHVDRPLGLGDGVRLRTYAYGRRSEAYAVIVHDLYQDHQYGLFLARLDSFFVSRPLHKDKDDVQLSFADNLAPAYASGFVTLLITKATYDVPHFPHSLDASTNEYILQHKPGKPIHATALLVASEHLPAFAHSLALPYLGRVWHKIVYAHAFADAVVMDASSDQASDSAIDLTP